jgi:MFS family permease
MSKPIASPEIPVVLEPKRSALSRIFQAFTYSDFRKLWFGAFTSSSGSGLQEAALGWILYQLTHKTRYPALNAFLSTAPILLFTLVGGVIADRWDRRRILIASQWVQLSCAFALAILTFSEAPTMILVWSALSLSFLTGCAQAFGGPAYQSLIPMLVEKKDLPNAIALNSIQFQLARIVGPLIGNFPFTIFADQLIAASVSFGLNGISFIAVIIALMTLKVSYIPTTGTGNMRSQLREGLSFVWRREALRSLTFLSFSSTFLGMQVMSFFMVFATDIFKTGVTGNFRLIMVSAAGAVVGALCVAALGHIEHKGLWALLTQIAFGVTIMAFSMASTVLFAYPVIFLASIFMMCVFSLTASLVQLIVSDEMRGRVMSIYMVAFRGGGALGVLLTGILAEYFPLTRILVVEGGLLSLIAFAFLISPSKVKEH